MKLFIQHLLLAVVFSVPAMSQCSIHEVVADFGSCGDDHKFNVHINFNFTNPGNAGFSLLGNGNDYGDFDYENLPIEITGLNGNCTTPWEFVVRDNAHPDCSSFVELGVICCNEVCDIHALVVEPGPCNDDGNYSVVINFEHSGTNGVGFDLYINNVFFDFYSYESLPLEANNFPSNGISDVFTVCENDNEMCCASLEVTPPCVCIISHVSALVLECSENGTFGVQLNFDYENEGNSGFFVGGNNQNYGQFAYADLPITINGLAGNGVSSFEFIVLDAEDPFCFDFTVVEPVDCSPFEICSIGNVVIDPLSCNADLGQFSFALNFDYENVSEEGFSVVGNGHDYGNFSYENLPVSLGLVEGTCEQIWEFIITDLGNAECQEEFVYDCLLPCCGNECNICLLEVLPYECNLEAGLFSFILDFNYSNPASAGFNVAGIDGYNFGDFEYSDLPIILSPVEGSCEKEWGFYVQDLENDDCNALHFLVEPFECCKGMCSISNIIVDPQECESENAYSLYLDFDHNGTNNEFFEVYSGDVNVAYFPFSDLPIIVEGFPTSGNDYDHITICENDNPHCCSSLEFLAPDCQLQTCEIWDLTVHVSDCTPNGIFSVELNFNYGQIGEQGFSVLGNGADYGDFEYASLPVTINPLPGDCETIYEFAIRDKQFENCEAAIHLTEPVCCSGDCRIWDLIAEAHGCADDGTFFVDIDFNYENVGDDGFQIVGNGHHYGSFEYGQDFYSLGPLPGDCETLYEFIVFDTHFGDGCSASIGFNESVCCQTDPECGFDAWSVHPTECQGNMLYGLEVNFTPVGTGELGFDAWTGDHYLGFYLYEDLPVVIPHFPASGNAYDVITICDNDSPNCCSTIEFEAITCHAPVCEIRDLHINITDCNSDGFFDVNINFEFENIGNEGFSVFGNGHEYGIFDYEDLAITIHSLAGDCETFYEFAVIDNQFENCGAEVNLEEVICCVEPCQIWDLVLDPGDCTGNGEYSLSVNFNHSGNGGIGFDVFSGGQFIGFYSYVDLPITIADFPQRVNADYDIITICDNDNPDCCITREFMGLNCAQSFCSIRDLIAEAHDCNEEGQFYVDITFHFEHVGSQGFQIVGNGHNYGSLEYGQDFYTIGPLDGNCETIYEFVVIDTETGDACSDSVGFEEPICCNANPDCGFAEIQIETGECTPAGTYILVINFIPVGTSNTSFDLWSGDHFIGYFSYADLPIVISAYESSGNHFDLLTICDNDNPDCCVSFEFETPSCVPVCEIWDLSLQLNECTPNGVFSADIDFEFENTGNEGFTIRGNGHDYGDFEYASLPVTIHGIPGNCETLYEFVVIDNQFENCREEVVLEEPVCCNEACEIWDLVLDPAECTGAGLFALYLDFNHSGTSGVGFDVFSGENFIGFWSYNEIPLTIPNFPERVNSNHDIIRICDNDKADCCISAEFMGTNCNAGGEICQIAVTNYEITSCNNHGQYHVVLEISLSSDAEEGYIVSGPDRNFGEFNTKETTITIGPFEGNGEHVYTITVAASQTIGCETHITFGPIDCHSTGVEDEFLEIDNVFVHSTGIFIQSEALVQPRFEFFTIIGQKIRTSAESRSPSEWFVPFDNVPGLYILQIQSEGKRKAIKFFYK